MTHVSVLTGALIGALLSASAPETVAFQPESGQALTKTFDQRIEADLVTHEVSITVNGEEHAREAPDVEVSIVEEQHVVFTDEFEEVADGRVTLLRRSFDELSTRSEESVSGEGMDDESNETEGSSELEGTSVVFTWDEDMESFEAEFAEDGDSDLLEDLEAETDLSIFLPPEDVSEGDTWSVEANAFHQLSSPSGDLAIETEDEEEDDSDDDTDEQLHDNLAGEISCEFMGTRDEDGTRMAVIRVTAELSTEASVEQDLQTEAAEIQRHRTMEIRFDLEGDLLWNLDEGRFHRIELAGSLEWDLEIGQSGQGEMEVEFLEVRGFVGSYSLTASFE